MGSLLQYGPTSIMTNAKPLQPQSHDTNVQTTDREVSKHQYQIRIATTSLMAFKNWIKQRRNAKSTISIRLVIPRWFKDLNFTKLPISTLFQRLKDYIAKSDNKISLNQVILVVFNIQLSFQLFEVLVRNICIKNNKIISVVADVRNKE